MGLFVIHPCQRPSGERRVDRDFALMLSEWAIEPGAARPNPNEMTDFNVLTINGKAFPGTAPLVAKLGDRVRIRIGNLGPMEHHPIHLHGYRFWLTATDGGRIPEPAWQPETTVLVAVGMTRDVEFVADNPGDWALHCHMTHHTMNQMGHAVTNLVGMDPAGLAEKMNALSARARQLLPSYMTDVPQEQGGHTGHEGHAGHNSGGGDHFMLMGATGMGGHAEHMQHVPLPRNSIPMKGAPGPFGYIDMGGMFTILKVREGITSYDDPGWYAHPPGTVARAATADELQRDGVETKPQ
jgi:hypothetical protein